MTQTAQQTSPVFLTLTDETLKKSIPHRLGDLQKLIDNKLFSKVSMFQYNQRARLLFSISEQVSFSLVKGLIEFNRLKNFSFRYDANARIVETDVAVDRYPELNDFFERIHTLANEELQFKRILKKVLHFEEQYKQRGATVYAEMKMFRVG